MSKALLRKNGYTISHETLEEMRMMAVRMQQQGHRVEAIASWMRLNRSSVFRWVQTYHHKGIEALSSKKATGAPGRLKERTDPATDRDVAQTGNGVRIRFGFVDRPKSQEVDQKKVWDKIPCRLHAPFFETAWVGSQESGASGLGARSPKGSSMAETNPAKNPKAGKAIQGFDLLRRRGFFLFDSSCGQDVNVSRGSSNCPGFGTKGHLGWSHLGRQSPRPSCV